MRRPVGGFVLAFVCLLTLGLAPQAGAAVSGAFFRTGSMLNTRTHAVAAPLPDGRVLVAGGNSGALDSPDRGRLRSAEIFDPTTNTFSLTGSMSVARDGPVAAPLPDGRVLVAGGIGDCDPCQPLSSAEIFDPATNSFSLTGSMSEPRAYAAAAPLSGGRVLVAGPDSSAEIFEPATNTFSSAGVGSMSAPRDGAVAAPLPDGRVLVAGGEVTTSSHGGPIGSTVFRVPEIFDPATNTFSSAGVGGQRAYAIAAPFPDGRVLIAGGHNGLSCGSTCEQYSSAEVYDPVTASSSSAGIGSMSGPRYGAAAAALPGGRVLVAGGCCVGTSSAEIFAPVSCRGKQATIVGTPGPDVLTGSARRDVVVGVGGEDRVRGLGGNDLICGGDGSDTLKGGKGKDKLFGETGNDKLNGGPGKDMLKGGPGEDILKGGPGEDVEAKEKPARHQH